MRVLLFSHEGYITLCQWLQNLTLCYIEPVLSWISPQPTKIFHTLMMHPTQLLNNLILTQTYSRKWLNPSIVNFIFWKLCYFLCILHFRYYRKRLLSFDLIVKNGQALMKRSGPHMRMINDNICWLKRFFTPRENASSGVHARLEA